MKAESFWPLDESQDVINAVNKAYLPILIITLTYLIFDIIDLSE